ncbi:hypothetical protein [uncultured Gimesia sp.]|uniref:hypothetical protein n=1 Tax=uncultured Gimesia sp. TaxID=1678688 RepID=UPI0030D735FD|tara:strand:+ start:93169 stop:93471 length:303 start_codon:yes stop_codon:yes gene_type:complete
MIENPKEGQEVVYILENGCLDRGVVTEITEDFAWFDVRGRRMMKATIDLYESDDLDGIVEGLKGLIDNCEMTIELIERDKANGRPYFKKPLSNQSTAMTG